MKTALVHDWLVTQGGAEKVLDSIWKLFNAPIYTLFYDKEQICNMPFFQEEIFSSFLQKIPAISHYYRYLFPLFPWAVEQLDLSEARLIISSSHAVAKGVKKRKDQLHICYCHTPMRYAWDLQDEYLKPFPFLIRAILERLLARIRRWDFSSTSGVDAFVANSFYVAERIERCYGRKATVIYPPVATDRFYLSSMRQNYFVTHARLVPYKKIDVLVQAFSAMPDKKLVIVGQGPEEKNLKKRATQNIDFVGRVSDEELAKILSQALAYLFVAQEDFGIGPVEAQSAGLPVIAFRKGGVLETVIEGKTGLFFSEQTASCVMDAIDEFEASKDRFDPYFIRNHANRFHTKRFEQEFYFFVQSCLSQLNET